MQGMDYSAYAQSQGLTPSQAYALNPYPGPPHNPSNMSTTSQQMQQHPMQHQTSPVLASQQNQSHNPMAHQSNYTTGIPYGMSSGLSNMSNVAMAATAAASGNYPQYMASDVGIGQTSPHQAPAVKNESHLLNSPSQMNNQSAAQQFVNSSRRMSQQIGTSPLMDSQQQIMNGGSSVPPMPSGVQHRSSHSPERAPVAVEESPLYVNAKQFHRILKRRVARELLQEQLKASNKGRKPYLHESRHNHAMRRPRGPGGRFLTADEVAEIDRKVREKNGDDPAPEISSSAATKRKVPSGKSATNKKQKTSSASSTPIEDEPEHER